MEQLTAFSRYIHRNMLTDVVSIYVIDIKFIVCSGETT
jgi:hypothetical protein